MDTTNERLDFVENMTWDELLEQDKRAMETLGVTTMVDDIKALRAERDSLRAENDGLKAQLTEAKAKLRTSEAKLKSARLDLEDMKISFECVRTMLAYYMKLAEALNPSKKATAKAVENAMKNMKKE